MALAFHFSYITMNNGHLQIQSHGKMFLLFWPFHGRLVVWTASCSQVVRHLALSWNFFVFFWQTWILLHFVIVVSKTFVSSSAIFADTAMQCDKTLCWSMRLLILTDGDCCWCWYAMSEANLKILFSWNLQASSRVLLDPRPLLRATLKEFSRDISLSWEHTERIIRQVDAQFNLFKRRSPGRPLY